MNSFLMGSAAKYVSTPMDLSTVNVERDTARLDHHFAQACMEFSMSSI